MRKQITSLLMALALACPMMAMADAEFGTIDAGKVFNQYNETQKTKKSLEDQKSKLQADLEKRKEEVKKLDDEYIKLAKETQDARDKKKDVSANEKKIAELRKQLAEKQGALQKFYEESQKSLYALEEKEMGNLSKNLEAKVDTVIEKVAKNYKLKAVFEKRSIYWDDKSSVKDITDEVIKALNSGK